MYYVVPSTKRNLEGKLGAFVASAIFFTVASAKRIVIFIFIRLNYFVC